MLRHAYRETRSSACEKASCKLPGIKAAKNPTYLHYKGSSISKGSLIMKIPAANTNWTPAACTSSFAATTWSLEEQEKTASVPPHELQEQENVQLGDPHMWCVIWQSPAMHLACCQHTPEDQLDLWILYDIRNCRKMLAK
jgi:hypothetical protein